MARQDSIQEPVRILSHEFLFGRAAQKSEVELARYEVLLAKNPEIVAFHREFSSPGGLAPSVIAGAVRGVEDSGIQRDHTVVVIGAGPIGLMLTALAVRRGAHVVVAGRNRGRLDKALELGASGVVDLSGASDPAALLVGLGPDRGGPDVVIEAVGLSDTSQAALRAVRKGGTVNLFAGCPADTRISIDSQRLHYEELTIRSTFHHTPQSVRAALGLIARGEIDPRRFITGAEPLERLPEVLDHMARGGDGLKTAILTWGSL